MPDGELEVIRRAMQCIVLSWDNIVDVESELQPQDPGDLCSHLPETVCVIWQGQGHDFDLAPEDAKGFGSAVAMLDLLQERIRDQFQIPIQNQLFFDKLNTRLDDNIAAFSQVFFGGVLRPVIRVEDSSLYWKDHDACSSASVSTTATSRSGGGRTLALTFNERRHNWLDLDQYSHLLSTENVGQVLRRSLAEHFHVPVEAQEIYDELGPLTSDADFRRALCSQSPSLRLYDRRTSGGGGPHMPAAHHDVTPEEESVQLAFDNLPLTGPNQTAFLTQLCHSLESIGVSQAAARSLRVQVLGSVVAVLTGPAASIQEVKLRDPSQVEVWGVKARVAFGKPLPRPHEQGAPTLQCPAGHRLFPFAYAEERICDACHAPVAPGQRVAACQGCGYDLCAVCTPQPEACAPPGWQFRR